MKKNVISILLIFVILFTIFIGSSYATQEENSPQEVAEEKQEEKKEEKIATKNNEEIYVNAKVMETGEITEEVTGSVKEKIQNVKVKILSGEYKGNVYDSKYILSYDTDSKILAYELEKGNIVSVQIVVEKDNKITVNVLDAVRQNYLIAIVLIFLGSIILIGGKKGIKTIIALVITVITIYCIMIANIYKGYSPIIMSILSSFIIIMLSFIILNGINKKSLSAALGTLGGVVLSGMIALVFGNLAKLSGGQEESLMLSMSSTDVVYNFRELLFAGIVIASLGACMDVAMSIASSLSEIRKKKPDVTWQELFKSGMSIGKDLIGTMTNTLILAYVGGALSLILLFMANNMSFLEIINKETIASEIISSISGSLGIIYTVPVTSIIYAWLHKDKDFYRVKSENKINGKRSLKL